MSYMPLSFVLNTKERSLVETLLVDKYAGPRSVYTELIYTYVMCQHTFNQVRDHSFITLAKSSEELTFVTP